jgi:hypothetical protein
MKLHMEIRVPYMPRVRGQGRGNSGVYLQDRYEVQVLDSFGLAPNKTEMGSVFDILFPIRYAALPPGTWQTYDIEFHVPAFDENGKKVRDANVTLVWNGVKVLDDEEIAKTTGGAAPGDAKEGPIRLQDHGNPVRFRNIWVVPLED